MEKHQFNLLVTRFNSLRQAEVNVVSGLLKSYPYSQVLHVLSARGCHDLNLEGKEKWLEESAVYSTDRSVLRWAMTALRVEIDPSDPVDSIPSGVSQPTTIINDSSSNNLKLELQIVPDQIEERFYEQVAQDLADLQQSKKRFEAMIAKLESTTYHAIDPVNLEESLIKELEQHAKKRVKIDAKQKEQAEIIEKFVKTQPIIPKPKSAPSTQVDLTEKSAVLSKEVISETLVDLLVKQGKKDRAIEMLKKLIWKFPQKKTYFAARIQELKK
ncbi:MAG: hypothetical protein ACKO96_26280 [Flammeovirgaceae bacterium]